MPLGRSEIPTDMQPIQSRRAERAQRAKDTVVKIIPEILRTSPRARHGIHRADLMIDPPSLTNNPGTNNIAPHSRDHPRIRIQCADTLTAASRMSERPFASRSSIPSSLAAQSKRPNVAILNMASSLRPGGGFLDGANSQEEFLCARTTLYASLWDSFYRLPEVGGVFTPDVMVFRDPTPQANELSKRDRFFVDVISAGMMRFPNSQQAGHEDGSDSPPCSCGVSYCDRDRDVVTRKMKAVLRMAEQNGARRLVLGAWGCGAYGNPVREVAKLWRKVIAGGLRQRRPNAEQWNGIRDIVFAIPDRSMAREFESAFGDILSYDAPSPVMDMDELDRSTVLNSPGRRSLDGTNEDEQIASLISRIAETEMQLEQTTNPRTKARIRDVLGDLNRELTQGLAARSFGGDDYTLAQDEDIEHDPTTNGVTAVGVEGNSFYNFDEDDVASDSSDCASSGIYDFRTRARSWSIASQFSQDPDAIQLQDLYAVLPPSPSLNAETGWYTGSIDQFHKYVRDAEAKVNGEESPRSLALDEIESDHASLESEQLHHRLR